MAGRKEVAEKAGVSEATVSRVFSSPDIVNAVTKRKVEQAAAALEYYPNAIAQSFARKKSGNIGVVLPYIPHASALSSAYFSEILHGATVAANEKGYDILLFYKRMQEEEVDYRAYFQNKKIDGLILLGTGVEDLPHLRSMRKENYPFVLLGNALHPEDPFAVDADHVSGGEKAMIHLAEQGHRTIAFLNGPPSFVNSRQRLKGVQSACAAYALFDPVVFTGNYSRTSGYELADVILDERPRPTAVFAANDRMAIGVMQRMTERHLRPGRDMAVVGYDDTELGRYMEPPLTSVAVPFQEIGAAAIQRLLAATEAAPDFLPVTLKIRASSQL
ncbi:LacI family DNA-binding transcriptional regulator [Salibacterium aidingense]|uniref:LacI family DNA-binding transcriptional regulator n=1 Tax=Salibacterium aidingense TaxID=384933 RepID=UPI0004113BA5|nr:LacI family DNA-binding transcriptional regulator [Salibacterium aidingense]